MTKPDWLPPLVSVKGDWTSIQTRLYTIFKEDFKDRTCTFRECAIDWDRRIEPGDKYEESFWHLITKTDQTTGQRFLDPRRAERLPWCSPTITHCPHEAIKAWGYLESGNRRRVYLWLEEWDYVVILEKRVRRGTTNYYLVTAYHVDGDSTRRSLRRKYSEKLPG